MPSWGEVLAELHQLQQSPPPDLGPGVSIFDYLRRKYLTRLQELTGRNVVVYTTAYLNPRPGAEYGIVLRDVSGLMEVFRSLEGGNLDLIIHSPGGSVEAVDRLVRYMRSKFQHIRAFIPLAAMSAATMWSLACDQIVMGKHSQLGPTDPQVQLPSGLRAAGELREEFEQAVEQCRNDPARLAAWLPILQQYPPGLLQMCQDFERLGTELVQKWLATYMFAGRDDRESKSREVAEYFANQKLHKSHGRGIDREQARSLGIEIVNLEDDQDLQDAVLSVHHSVLHTFSNTPVTRLVENHLGRAWIEQTVTFPMPQPIPQPVQRLS